ncbi:MAG: hypothetical protein HQK56_04850 [Deltaproteobacteria bacterium]|nr:hypothetical protein [Deltaproteobacteria bacterium]
MIEFTDERHEALVELINICFGRAMASLAELLETHIHLSVPVIRSVNPEEVIKVLTASIEDKDEVTIVQQAFGGEFAGEAVLALPGWTSQSLVSMLTEQSGFTSDLEIDKLNLEVILEVGNIVIGACLGQFAELLESRISYSPPAVFLDRITSAGLKERLTTREIDALLVQTKFSHREREVTGYLFFFLSQFCLEGLFGAVDRFIKKMS